MIARSVFLVVTDFLGEMLVFACQHHVLHQQAQMNQQQQDRRCEEKAEKWDRHFNDGQFDRTVEQQIPVGDTGKRDQQIGEQPQMGQPSIAGRPARRIRCAK